LEGPYLNIVARGRGERPIVLHLANDGRVADTNGSTRIGFACEDALVMTDDASALSAAQVDD